MSLEHFKHFEFGVIVSFILTLFCVAPGEFKQRKSVELR